LALDQFQLPRALPFLDLALAAEGIMAGVMDLKPDQDGDSLLRGKAGPTLLTMLDDAFDQAIG
tara:strand:- start:1208 stop:1396 length:189 start_codon:yes stop_codon:yes gene_type:complete